MAGAAGVAERSAVVVVMTVKQNTEATNCSLL